MRCPYCGNNDTKVLDSRESADITRRRRECLRCEKRFTTFERVEQVEIGVIKKDKRREAFDREKVKKGISRACEKRPVTIEQIEKVVKEIESKVRGYRSTQINSKVIGEEISKALKKLDKVAYIRFASVYREFKDVDEFKKELRSLK